MLVHSETRNVQTSKVLDSKRTTIVASPESVRRFILPYTQNELAAVREILNNAADASTRIDMQAPNLLEPTVRIRDYGPGIPTAQVYDHLSRAGYSTKTQTNETTDADGNTISVMGCKGVGRYAPLGVAESFMFRNFSEGRMIVGQIYFGSDGMPTVDIIADEPSAEPSGVEVTFAVDTDKIGAIRNAFRAVLTHFPSYYQLNWIGEPVEVDPPVSRMMGDGWWFGPGPAILMGRIAYEVNPSQFYHWHHSGMHDGLSEAFQNRLLLRVPLGSIDVNDARESVVYNARTYAAVDAAFRKIVDDVKDKALTAVTHAPTLWEATRAFSEAHTTGLSRLFKGTRTYGSATLERHIPYNGAKLGMQLAFIGKNGGRARSTETRFRPDYITGCTIDPTKTLVVENDLPNKSIGKRFANAAESGDLLKLVPGFKHDRYDTDYMSHYFVVLQSPLDQRQLDALGNPPIAFKLSDLPEPPKQPTQPGVKRNAPITPYVIGPNGGIETPATPLDLNDTTVTWAKYDGSRINLEFDPAKHPLAAAVAPRHSYGYVRALSNGKQIALCIKKFHYRASKAKWSRLEDEIEASLTAMFAKPEVQDTLALLRFSRDKVTIASGIASDLAHDFTHTEAVAKALKFVRCHEDQWHIVQRLDAFDKYKNTSDIVNRLKKLLDDKPLLRYLVSRNTAPTADVTDYINS